VPRKILGSKNYDFRDYYLTVARRYAYPDNQEICAGQSLGSW
jgi:hypothetical protein